MARSERPRKSPRDSRVEVTTLVLPEDTNHYGNLFGGRLLAMLDKAAYICATRHCRLNCVTASIEHVDFLAPVKEGFFVTLLGRINFVHRSSMEIGVEVEAENPLTGERSNPCNAILTFVALGDDGRPTEVPLLRLRSRDEKRRWDEGRKRFQARGESGRLPD